MSRSIFFIAFLGAAPSHAVEVDFAKQVLPIINASCIECHKAPTKDPAGKVTNPKGGLRLDGASFMIKGGSGGAAVEPGNPDNSQLYTRMLLPPDHEDVMPPKGKGKAVGFDETELIKQWIIEGAKFGAWKGADGAAAVVARPGAAKKAADPLAAGVAEAPAEALSAIAKLGGVVGPVSAESKLIRVEWVSAPSSITDKEAANLRSLAANITELDFSDTKITDETLKLVGTFTRLTRLNLANTAVTDAGIAHLKGLVYLDTLNVHGTSLSDESLVTLANLKKLRHVFLWKTRVTPPAATKLQKSITGLSVSLE
jgi:hypothetical protein